MKAFVASLLFCADLRTDLKVEMNQVKIFRRSILLFFIVTSVAAQAIAQNKQLTIDDIFDPQKRVNFSGTPVSPRWLKDGVHFTVVSRDRNAFPRLLKVNAVTRQG